MCIWHLFQAIGIKWVGWLRKSEWQKWLRWSDFCTKLACQQKFQVALGAESSKPHFYLSTSGGPNKTEAAQLRCYFYGMAPLCLPCMYRPPTHPPDGGDCLKQTHAKTDKSPINRANITDAAQRTAYLPKLLSRRCLTRIWTVEIAWAFYTTIAHTANNDFVYSFHTLAHGLQSKCCVMWQFCNTS